jgi:hypothetical protein
MLSQSPELNGGCVFAPLPTPVDLSVRRMVYHSSRGVGGGASASGVPISGSARPPAPPAQLLPLPPVTYLGVDAGLPASRHPPWWRWVVEADAQVGDRSAPQAAACALFSHARTRLQRGLLA